MRRRGKQAHKVTNADEKIKIREGIKYSKNCLMDQKVHQAVGNLNEAVELLEEDDFEGALMEIVLAWQAVMVKLCQS